MLRSKPDRLKTTLIVLTVAAASLAVLTYFVLFYPTGSYQPVVMKGPGTSFGNLPTSTAPLPSSTAGASAGGLSVPPGGFGSEYSSPYPLSWNEGGVGYTITGALLFGNRLTLTLAVQMGNASQCIAIEPRYVADESGTLNAPDAPAGPNYVFPDTQSCNGTPGAAYSESLVFTINPAVAAFTFTTGGPSNTFFQISTTTPNGIQIQLPSQSG